MEFVLSDHWNYIKYILLDTVAAVILFSRLILKSCAYGHILWRGWYLVICKEPLRLNSKCSCYIVQYLFLLTVCWGFLAIIHLRHSAKCFCTCQFICNVLHSDPAVSESELYLRVTSTSQDGWYRFNEGHKSSLAGAVWYLCNSAMKLLNTFWWLAKHGLLRYLPHHFPSKVKHLRKQRAYLSIPLKMATIELLS